MRRASAKMGMGSAEVVVMGFCLGGMIARVSDLMGSWDNGWSTMLVVNSSLMSYCSAARVCLTEPRIPHGNPKYAEAYPDSECGMVITAA